MNKEKRIESYDRYAKLVEARGITNYRVAKETGVSTPTFTDWKNGRSMPKIDKLIKIGKFLGVSPEYFVG